MPRALDPFRFVLTRDKIINIASDSWFWRPISPKMMGGGPFFKGAKIKLILVAA